MKPREFFVLSWLLVSLKFEISTEFWKQFNKEYLYEVVEFSEAQNGGKLVEIVK